MKNIIKLFTASTLFSFVSCGSGEQHYIINESDISNIEERIDDLEGRIRELESIDCIEEDEIDDLQNEVESIKEDLDDALMDEADYGPLYERR